MRESRWRREIEVAGERLSYEVYECDARTDEQCAEDARRGALRGDLIVVIPGHWQTADSAKLLIGASAAEGRSGVAWSVDIDPPRGGDPVKAQALPLILEQNAARLFAGGEGAQDSVLRYGRGGEDVSVGAEDAQDGVLRHGSVDAGPRLPVSLSPRPRVLLPPGGGTALTVRLFGWSHGGGEALRTAGLNPALFPRVAAICSAGLVERSLWEMIPSFVAECLSIAWFAIAHGGPAYRRRVIAILLNILGGIYRDLAGTRSLRRVARDIWWVARKVPGPAFRYDGEVVLILGADDRVIRWRDVFPECIAPEEVAGSLEALRQRDYPRVRSLRVRVLPGNHLSPDTDVAYARTALEMTG